MLKKHQGQEQSIDDFADTVQQLSQTSRAMIDEDHPQRYQRILSLWKSVSVKVDDNDKMSKNIDEAWVKPKHRATGWLLQPFFAI